jgi:PAS domain S-box-containing protein
MSLKTRLRLSVLIFLLCVVVGFSLLHAYAIAQEKFDHARDHATLLSALAKVTVTELINQRAKESPLRPATPGEMKELWKQLAVQDTGLSDALGRVMGGSDTVLSISLVDNGGMILSSSNPNLIGARAQRLTDFQQWVKRGPAVKAWDVAQADEDYGILTPLGSRGGSDPVFSIQVRVGSVLLRNQVFPDLYRLSLITIVAMGLSGLAAYLVSRWATQPIETIVKQIELVSIGQTPAGDFETKELMAVQSKLDLLGQRVRGARETAALRSNVEQMIERLDEAVLLFDPNGVLILCGQPASRLFGRPVDQLLGRRIEEVFPLETSYGQALQHSMERNQPLRNFSFSIPAAGREWRVLMSAQNLESFPDLERLGVLVTLRDVDSRREIESQLGVSTRLEAISKLLSGVAHEIKNPLNAMALHLELLRSQVTDTRALPSLDVIGREIFRLDRVVKTFLDFTRPVDLRPREVDLQRLLEEVVALVRPDAENRRVVVEPPQNVGSAMILADPDLIKQAVLNVVVNGVESMPEGGRLRVALERSGSQFVVTVADTGTGIPAHLREKVFQLYFSTKHGGSGLGLAMTFRAMQLHNGSVEFDSSPGTGTTFRLSFPRVPESGLRTGPAAMAVGP